MYRCPCASRVPIHKSMCIDAHTCIRIRKRACVYVHVHVHQCICASIPMCLRGCLRARVCGVRIYRCTFVRINTHRHTRTYPGGNTHPCVCVCGCVCVCVCLCVCVGECVVCVVVCVVCMCGCVCVVCVWLCVWLYVCG